jgi:ribosomal protein L7/L12
MNELEIHQRLAALEAQVALLSQHAGVACPPFGGGPQGGRTVIDPLAEVAELARAGRTLDAIRRYRELTDAGLADAKRAVEAM